MTFQNTNSIAALNDTVVPSIDRSLPRRKIDIHRQAGICLQVLSGVVIVAMRFKGTRVQQEVTHTINILMEVGKANECVDLWVFHKKKLKNLSLKALRRLL